MLDPFHRQKNTKDMNRLKEALQEIWDGPCSCSVCHQRLSPTAVSCLGGHMVCLSCRQRLSSCLVCQKRFSAEAPHAAFKRVLESLPRCCKYPGCAEVPEDTERLREHETWCGHRTALCRLCSWSGPARELCSHCLKQHFVIRKSQQLLDVVLNLTQDQSSLCLMHAHDQLFWVTCAFERDAGLISIRVLWEPDGAVTNNLFEAKVSFEFGSGKTSMTKPIVHQITGDTAQLNLFKIHLSSIKSFNVGLPQETVRFGLLILKK